jgi:hypothetical protein
MIRILKAMALPSDPSCFSRGHFLQLKYCDLHTDEVNDASKRPVLYPEFIYYNS